MADLTSVLVGTKIYAVPYGATSIMVLNTADDTVSTVTGYSDTDSYKYRTSIVVGGKIYAFPYSAQTILVIEVPTPAPTVQPTAAPTTAPSLGPTAVPTAAAECLWCPATTECVENTVEACPATPAPTPLAAGDIAVIGYNSDAPDTIVLIALDEISAGQSFTVTGKIDILGRANQADNHVRDENELGDS